jgi:hypothetical protein
LGITSLLPVPHLPNHEVAEPPVVFSRTEAVKHFSGVSVHGISVANQSDSGSSSNIPTSTKAPSFHTRVCGVPERC